MLQINNIFVSPKPISNVCVRNFQLIKIMPLKTNSRTIKKINPQNIPYYSDKDIAYQMLDERYAPFYKYKPELASFKKAIEDKSRQKLDRKLVVEVITEEYIKRKLTKEQQINLERLKDENSFTIVSAHQPSLFTGPLYFIYKICSAIKLSAQLNVEYPDNNFIPLFISGGEDHDFDEINHASLFGKEIVWNKEVNGSVGRIKLDNDFKEIINQFTEVLGTNNYGSRIKEILNDSLSKCTTYGEFNFHIVNELFQEYGLLVINMDSQKLKKAFIPILEKELIEQPSQSLVMATQDDLDKVGFSSQAYPREINLFYLQENSRKRIEQNGDYFYVVDSSIRWQKDEIIDELRRHPERFSPNVVIRPLYQEYILPNLAYIGGGGEIAYWLERKKQFEFFNVPYPILIRRNSAMLIPAYLQEQMEELGLSDEQLFEDENTIINAFLAEQASVDISLNEELSKITNIFETIAYKAEQIDPPLAKWVLAEGTKTSKLIEQMESRIKRSIKKKEENKVNQIRKIKQKLFPNNGLQERHDNFFQYYLTEGDDLIADLIADFDPLDNKFSILYL